MEQKKYTDGTHRSRSPRETFLKIKPFLKQMGITRVANVTGLDRINIPVFAAYRPNSKSLAVSQGKGHSIDAARVKSPMVYATTGRTRKESLVLMMLRPW